MRKNFEDMKQLYNYQVDSKVLTSGLWIWSGGQLLLLQPQK